MADITEPQPAQPSGQPMPAPLAPEAATPVATTPVATTSASFAPGVVAAPNLAVGVTAGTGLGFLAAVVYSVVAIFSDREFLILGLLIGFAIAFGFHRFGRTRGVVPGLIAVVIAVVMYGVAIFITMAGALAQVYEVSFMDGLRFAVEFPGEVVSAYFSEVTSYLFFGVSMVAAFYYAWGGRQRLEESRA